MPVNPTFKRRQIVKGRKNRKRYIIPLTGCVRKETRIISIGERANFDTKFMRRGKSGIASPVFRTRHIMTKLLRATTKIILVKD